MSIDLHQIATLVKNHLTFSDEKEYHITLSPDQTQKSLLTALDDSGYVEEFSNSKGIIFANNIKLGETIKVKLVLLRLERSGFYDTFGRFVDGNALNAPENFYLRDLDYMHGDGEQIDSVKAYFAGLKLSECLNSLARFKNEDDGLTLYLMLEKSATSLKVLNSVQTITGLDSTLQEVNTFCNGIYENIERKKIYQKELIDFLNDFDFDQRYSKLCKNFGTFYQRCESAYDFFLSDFSYGKLKLELESAVLEYSKNIRSIINDSQNKLIAIPAAFLIASSQLSLDTPFSGKNMLILIASIVFSVLIEIFIRNQESSVTIFTDNIKNYKTTFGFKNRSVDRHANSSLNNVINKTFASIDTELTHQRTRLNTIRWINWGISILLVMTILINYAIVNFGKK
ncbi:MAG: hypothetical protein P0Y49_04835 [Candidatus Pedobacter colombiensis]|uniref:Uncharacterized protein n=1 Tax=Candidatus Pedobacter colombiensis TaxID=3121371 RepID=A0AAJ6B6W5_9SPHI|nr:hypothetical protein [Pedobacter sp.]WEK20462.1 MAG: hypothetical protein P0Y49_04835 [Pedobacter sp.]